jgi:predicted Fe-Mo cluster-binding NifX family protein
MRRRPDDHLRSHERAEEKKNARIKVRMRNAYRQRFGMKICITAGASGLDALVDPRFGRCPFFIVVDLDTMDAVSVANQSATAPGGAGIQAAQAVAKLGVSALITGNVGPNAHAALNAAGIEIYQLAGGSVREAVEKFKRKELAKLSGASVPPHAGMGRGGGGMGRGGGGRGRGGGGQGREPGGGGRW